MAYIYFAHFLMAVFLAAVFIQVIWGISNDPVKIWDEAATAESAVTMLDNKDFLVVHQYGVPDHLNTRPPLSVWTKVFTFSIFGINSFSVRLPSIIATVLLVIMILYFYRKHFKNHLFYSLVSLLIIACTDGFMKYHVARTGDPDALLVFFIAFYSISFFLLTEYYPVKRNKYYLLFGAGIVLAFYTKSIAGLSPLAGLGIYMLTQKNGRKMLKDYRFYLTSLAVLIISFAYYPLREIVDPGFIKAVFENEVGIINDPISVKFPSKLFYWEYLRDDAFVPFYSYMPYIVFPLLFSKNPRVRRLLLFAFISAAVFVIGNSFVTIKNWWYIAPVYPYLWLLTGVGISEIIIRGTNFIKNEWIKRMIYLLFIATLALNWFPYYQFIFTRNNSNPHNFIYEPERAGVFLDLIKEEMPELNRFSVITKRHTRQMNFYAQKWNYLDDTKVEFVRKIHEADMGNYIIICDSTIWKDFERQHSFFIMQESKYCKLYKVD